MFAFFIALLSKFPLGRIAADIRCPVAICVRPFGAASCVAIAAEAHGVRQRPCHQPMSFRKKREGWRRPFEISTDNPKSLWRRLGKSWGKVYGGYGQS